MCEHANPRHLCSCRFDKKERDVLSYPDNAILTQEELARWIGVSPRTVQDWPIPRLRYPTSHPRYSARQVLAWLEGREP